MPWSLAARGVQCGKAELLAGRPASLGARGAVHQGRKEGGEGLTAALATGSCEEVSGKQHPWPCDITPHSKEKYELKILPTFTLFWFCFPTWELMAVGQGKLSGSGGSPNMSPRL